MSQENVELSGMAEAAFGALNSGDLDAFLALATEDVEFTWNDLISLRSLKVQVSPSSETDQLSAMPGRTSPVNMFVRVRPSNMRCV